MGTVLPFPHKEAGGQQQIGFTRFELNRIVDLYGRMVAAGIWKDYAIAFAPDAAAFWAFRRTAENNGWSLTGGVAASRGGAAATVGAEWVFN